MKEVYTRLGQPHIQHIGQTFSVTFITYDAIPNQELERLKHEKQVALSKIKQFSSNKQKKKWWEIHSSFDTKMEDLLNAKTQQEHLFKNNEAASILQRKIHAFDGVYYKLAAYCIMSNHVHLLVDFSVQVPKQWDGISPIENYLNVGDVTGRIKGGSAFEINKTLARSGQVWRLGYYDRYIRSEEHFDQTVSYIINNPVKAKLVKDWTDYPYTYISDLLTN